MTQSARGYSLKDKSREKTHLLSTVQYIKTKMPRKEVRQFVSGEINMKITFIVTEFPSLSQTFVLNQITGLIDRGHEVDIFANRAGDDSKTHEDVRKYNLLERTSYHGKIYKSIPKNKLFRLMKSHELCS